MVLERHRPPSLQDFFLAEARISVLGGKQELHFRAAARLYQGVGDEQGHAILPPPGHPSKLIEVHEQQNKA